MPTRRPTTPPPDGPHPRPIEYRLHVMYVGLFPSCAISMRVIPLRHERPRACARPNATKEQSFVIIVASSDLSDMARDDVPCCCCCCCCPTTTTTLGGSKSRSRISIDIVVVVRQAMNATLRPAPIHHVLWHPALDELTPMPPSSRLDIYIYRPSAVHCVGVIGLDRSRPVMDH